MKEEKEIRIARYIALCGITSRRKSEAFVLNGRVKVNGKVIKQLSFKVDKDDAVELNGRRLKYQGKRTLALNKPAGYLSTVKDDFRRKTVLDLIEENDFRLYPVGRLDYDSRGLMILTNDGDLAYRVTHPKFGIPKTYEVTIDKKFDSSDIDLIKKGIEIEGREIIPLGIKTLCSEDDRTTLEIKIVEGRKRILRKTFKKIGYNVIDLKRTGIGSLKLNGLEEGQAMTLKQKDLDNLLSER